jgi:hypothetical protein
MDNANPNPMTEICLPKKQNRRREIIMAHKKFKNED